MESWSRRKPYARPPAASTQADRAGQTSFVAGDPHQTAFNEGARDAYLHIAEMIGLEPGELVEPARSAAADER